MVFVECNRSLEVVSLPTPNRPRSRPTGVVRDLPRHDVHVTPIQSLHRSHLENYCVSKLKKWTILVLFFVPTLWSKESTRPWEVQIVYRRLGTETYLEGRMDVTVKVRGKYKPRCLCQVFKTTTITWLETSTWIFLVACRWTYCDY